MFNLIQVFFVKHIFSFRLVTGLPDCGPVQPWPILHYRNSTDQLRLLPNGILRHYFDYSHVPGEESFEMEKLEEHNLFYDYEPGKYCLDRVKEKILYNFITLKINFYFRILVKLKVSLLMFVHHMCIIIGWQQLTF